MVYTGPPTLVPPPPSPWSIIKAIAELQADGTLLFKGAKNADGKDNKLEMTLTTGNKAKLKFFGTPVENNPWELSKQS